MVDQGGGGEDIAIAMRVQCVIVYGHYVHSDGQQKKKWEEKCIQVILQLTNLIWTPIAAVSSCTITSSAHT